MDNRILGQLTEKQLDTLTKEPFWFPEIEPEKIHKVGMSGHFDQTRSDKNKVVEMYVSTDFSENALRVKVRYEHLNYDTGGDGVPPGYYSIIKDYYFIILNDGNIERNLNNLTELEESSYLIIDINSIVSEKIKNEINEYSVLIGHPDVPKDEQDYALKEIAFLEKKLLDLKESNKDKI